MNLDSDFYFERKDCVESFQALSFDSEVQMETVEEIFCIVKLMRKKADSRNLKMLSYLLDMVALEAGDLLHHNMIKKSNAALSCVASNIEPHDIARHKLDQPGPQTNKVSVNFVMRYPIADCDWAENSGVQAERMRFTFTVRRQAEGGHGYGGK